MSRRPIVLAFAASNNTQSINRKFVEHAAQVLQEEIAPEVEIETLDLNDYEMPIYSPDREKTVGIPKEAHAFLNKLGAADGLIISFAEYNGSYTSAFKNIFDWVSRIEMNIFQGKPMIVLATSPGRRGGQSVLGTVVSAAPFFGGDIKGSLSVGPYEEHFNATTGRLSQPESALALREALVELRNSLSATASHKV